MKNYETSFVSPIDSDGTLSTDFVERSGSRVRVLAGAPTLLELGIISAALRSQASVATFELFESDGTLSRSYEAEPTVTALVDLMHEKFARAALVRIASNSEMAFFEHSNDYFLFLAKNLDLDTAFKLDRDQMADYFEDIIEDGLDKDHLRSIWARYERYM
jgi:hypothetical protein